MDRLKGLGTTLVGTAGNVMDKSKAIVDKSKAKISQLKENYLNQMYVNSV